MTYLNYVRIFYLIKENTQVDKFAQRLKMHKRISETLSLNSETAICDLIAPICKHGKTMRESMIAERLLGEIHLDNMTSETDLIRKAKEKQKKILKEEGIL